MLSTIDALVDSYRTRGDQRAVDEVANLLSLRMRAL
jgi:hypothetical protein